MPLNKLKMLKLHQKISKMN